MDDVFTLVIFAAMIWSMIGGALGRKGKGAPPAPRPDPRPGARRPAPARRQAPGHGDPSDARPAEAHGDASEPAAADMIPEDLWELLTGERRRPRPEPAGEREAPDAGSDGGITWEGELTWDDEDARGEERAAASARRPGDESRAWDDEPARDRGRDAADRGRAVKAESVEEMPRLEEPIVVSMETPPPPPELRHRIFHERLEASRPVRRTARRRSIRGLVEGRDSLRRAVILREVLGPPKALE